jgi:hypothetical protein
MKRNLIKKTTTNRKIYKCMHQDRIFYFETCRWCYKRPLINWKYWRKTQWK